TGRREREVRRVMERSGRAPDGAKVHARRAGVRRLAGPQRREELALRRVLADDVPQIIAAVDGVVGPDRDPVRPGEVPFAPRLHEVAVAVEDDDRMLAAVEDEDPILRVDRNTGDLRPGKTRRQLVPAIIRVIAKFAAGLRGHGVLTSSGGSGNSSAI